MRWLGQVVVAPLVALSFLTVLPVPLPRFATALPMGWAVACFPLGGAAIGLALAGLDRLLGAWFPAPVPSAFLLATLLAVTGALHLDGLMDSFDGLFGGKDRASRLAIMKDSRVGSFGIAAAAGVLLLQFSSLAALRPDSRFMGIVLAIVLSRWAMAALMWLFPAATPTGLAAGLKPQIGPGHIAVATSVAVGAAAIAGVHGLALAGAACLMMLLAGRVAQAKIGGVTGDSCGAVGVLVETVVLAGASIWV